MTTTGSKLEQARLSQGVSLAQVAVAGGWRGPSSVQRYFESDYDLSVRRDVADRLAKSLGPRVYEIAGMGLPKTLPPAEAKDCAAKRLRQARIDAGHASASAAANARGWEVGTYRHHENGTRNYGVDQAILYGEAFRVSADWLLLGEQTGHRLADLEINGVPQPERVIVNGIVYLRQPPS